MKILKYDRYILRNGSGIVVNDRGQSIFDDVVVLHFDTTGLSAEQDEITRIGAVKISGGQIVETFRWIGFSRLCKVMSQLEVFCENCVVVAQHAYVAREFFVANAVDKARVLDITFVDIFTLSVLLLPKLRGRRITDMAAVLGVEEKNICSVQDKAEYEARVYLRLVEILREKEIRTFSMAQDSMEKVLKE